MDNNRRSFGKMAMSAGVSSAAVVLSACGGAQAAAPAAAPASAPAPAAQFPSKPETIVLLHGSWHGSWCWQKVRPLLLQAGYDTLAPTLTGQAERAGYGSLSVGLRSHTEEVARLLEFNDLKNVVLVGHSYAGAIISGVAETMASRIKRLVYLDAFVMNDGEAAFDFFPPGVPDFFRNLATSGNGWGVPALPAEDFIGPSAPAADKDLLTRLLTPLPVNTHSEKLVAPTAKWATLPKTYISCLRFPNLDAIKTRVKAQTGWQYKEIDTYHDCMITTPDTLANLIIEAAA
jgi:pimeloyl-ACP methyl ester carboxylesterase